MISLKRKHAEYIRLMHGRRRSMKGPKTGLKSVARARAERLFLRPTFAPSRVQSHTRRLRLF